MLRPSPDRRPTDRSLVRGGFTLIELLVVMIIIGVLIALLLPAITGAIRTARKAAVSSEISLLAQALANFKSKYGDYPPSRFLAVESGHYEGYIGDTTPLSTGTVNDPTSPGTGDIVCGQLAQRSAAYLRKFWPRVSTTGAPAGQWYDFNGNGIQDPAPYVLHGHECLVFFLGGIPSSSDIQGLPTSTFGLNGFGKDPTNPFSNTIANDPRLKTGGPNAMYNANRQPPLFEFNAGRLFVDSHTQTAVVGVPGFPAYYDSLNSGPPTGSAGFNFYAYFSAYGNNGYDPNDVNFTEADAGGNGPIGLYFSVAYPVNGGGYDASLAPNPYTSTLTVTASTTNTAGPPAVAYQNAQSFQIISSGLDGLYGVGGQYVTNSTTSSTQALPFDSTTSPTPYIGTTDHTVRIREDDNLTNFKSGSLQ
jgi:general secretion pathway protein G